MPEVTAPASRQPDLLTAGASALPDEPGAAGQHTCHELNHKEQAEDSQRHRPLPRRSVHGADAGRRA